MQQTFSNPASSNLSVSRSDSFLRNTLLVNASISALIGLLCAFDSKVVDSFLGLGMPRLILVLGIGLLLFAAELFWVATRPKINRMAAQIITALDVGWVVGSIVLLAAGVPALSDGGWWAVAILADVVAVFAICEFVGLRRMRED